MSDQAPRDSIGSDAGQAAADSICTGFTRGWMTGQRPGIVDVLAEVEAEARPALLRRLLPLELEFRRATGEEPKAADYSEHLGEFADVIVEFFEKSVPTAGVSTAEDTETIVRSPRPSPSLPPDSPLAEESTSDRHGDATPQPPDRDAPDSEQLGAVELSPGETDQTIVESAAVTPDSNAKSFETDLDLSPVAKADPARTLLEDGETINVRPQTTSASDSEFGYDLIQEIARGGMGVVFKARQKKLKRIVALKMILSGQLASQEEIRRFYVEAEAAAALDHPNIVPIYEVGEHNGQHFFSMGFIEGTSLTAWAQMKKPSPVDAALVIKTVAEAVHYAHQHGIIHRDLKPANILMDGDRPHVTDFGLARNLEGDSAMTTTGQIMGTPSYMPPEQARGDLEAIGPASDVYSLGVILYELLVGRPPFNASRVLETLELVQHAEPTPPRSLNRSVDRDLDTIVLKCLRKDTSERYASAQELADEIERYRNGEPILARRIGPVARAWRWCRRKPILTGLVAAVLLAAVSLTVVFSLGRQVRDARAVATIRDELALRLAQPQLDVEWLASFDQPLAKAAALDTKAAGDFRSSVHSSYVTHIRAKLREARLSADDYSKIEKALSGLATRDGDVTGLRELLEQRKSDWQLLVEFAAPWESMPEVNQPLRQTDAALVLVGDDKQIPVVTRSVPLVSIDSGNRVRIEARFDDAWRNSARIGLTLLLRGQQGYGFQLRVPDSIESAGEDEPPSPKQPAQPDTTATDE